MSIVLTFARLYSTKEEFVKVLIILYLDIIVPAVWKCNLSRTMTYKKYIAQHGDVSVIRLPMMLFMTLYVAVRNTEHNIEMMYQSSVYPRCYTLCSSQSPGLKSSFFGRCFSVLELLTLVSQRWQAMIGQTMELTEKKTKAKEAEKRRIQRPTK